MKPLLLVLTGHAPDAVRARHRDFGHWFRTCLRLPPARLRAIDVQAGEALPPPAMCAGALFTGSPAMVTDREVWSERSAEWIRIAMDRQLPLFGVCYGHQLMAHALGGDVGELPGGREIGTVDIERIADDPWLPRPARFRAHATHRQSVLVPPVGATVLARSARDPNQVLRYGSNALSVQFHPEFSVAVMQAYLRNRAALLREEGLDLDGLLKATAATPHARAMLRTFARAVQATV